MLLKNDSIISVIGTIFKANTSINLNPVSDFCKSSSASLKESCGKLTKKNCNSTSCCIVLNGEKCVAGNQDGPTFKT